MARFSLRSAPLLAPKPSPAKPRSIIAEVRRLWDRAAQAKVLSDAVAAEDEERVGDLTERVRCQHPPNVSRL
jgi:hypothetical protein